jgi:hypothetical protein
MPFKSLEDKREYQRNYHRKYDKKVVYNNPVKRDKILLHKREKYAKDKETETEYRDINGHIKLIWGAVAKFIKELKRQGKKEIVLIKYLAFKSFSKNDLRYQELHADWVANDYDDNFAPVISRIEFNKGYVEGNLFWGTKRQFGISKSQKAAISDLASVVAEIERTHTAKAQAPKSAEQEEKAKIRRKELREMLARQNAAYKAAMGK